MSDAVIVESVRSPGGRYKRGGLAQTRSDNYGIQVLKGLLARVPELDPADIDDLIVGCSFPECEQGMNLGRILAMGAGLPISVCGQRQGPGGWRHGGVGETGGRCQNRQTVGRPYPGGTCRRIDWPGGVGDAMGR